MWIRVLALLLVGLIAISESVLADGYKPNSNTPQFSNIPITSNCCTFLYNTVITVTEGAAFNSNAGQSNKLGPINSEIFVYTPNNANQTVNLVGIFLGGEFLVNNHFAFQAGIGYYQPGALEVNGKLLQGVDKPSSDMYGYSYKILSRQLLFETKWMLVMGDYEEYHPYFSFGLGGAFNRSYDYQTTIPPFLTFTPVFASYTKTSFTYNLGIGFEVDLNPNWRVGIGYRFTDFGNVTFDTRIDTTPISGVLSQEHLYINEAIAQLTYIF